MNLEETPQRGVNVVQLTYRSVVYLDWVLAPFDIHDFCTINRMRSIQEARAGSSPVEELAKFLSIESSTHNYKSSKD